MNLEQNIQKFLDRALMEINQNMNQGEKVSDCCARKVHDDTDICSECLEHCEIINI
tara:strand:+ start:20046 stop:20213 length:168 start_codon:yes stop_codon:yes gene_type:complete